MTEEIIRAKEKPVSRAAVLKNFWAARKFLSSLSLAGLVPMLSGAEFLSAHARRWDLTQLNWGALAGVRLYPNQNGGGAIRLRDFSVHTDRFPFCWFLLHRAGLL